MARKSRKNRNKTDTAPICPHKSMTGIYARLSVEDNHYGSGDSLAEPDYISERIYRKKCR